MFSMSQQNINLFIFCSEMQTSIAFYNFLAFVKSKIVELKRERKEKNVKSEEKEFRCHAEIKMNSFRA